jgi:hypothetical protein
MKYFTLKKLVGCVCVCARARIYMNLLKSPGHNNQPRSPSTPLGPRLWSFFFWWWWYWGLNLGLNRQALHQPFFKIGSLELFAQADFEL